MGWTKIGLLLLILIFIFTVNYFGGHFGYTVHGVPKGGSVGGSTPSIFDLSFMWDLMSFQIDGVPEYLSIVFIIISLLALYILVTTILPGGG